jgi:hypothetical protein
MNKSQMIALFNQDQRKDVEFPGLQREVTPNVVRHIDTSNAGEGMITYSQLNEANAEESISEQVAFYESIGQNFEWKIYDYDQPPDLKERLVSFGFVVEEVEAVMLLDLEDAPEILRQPVLHDVQRITDPETISDVQIVEEQVWGEDFSDLGGFLRETLSRYPERMSVYLAYVDERPVSSAWILFTQHSQFASLWGGSTVRELRKQGLYTALLAVRAQEAKARQVRYLVVDASVMSRPILEKFGFKLMAYSYPCKWKLESQKQRVIT